MVLSKRKARSKNLQSRAARKPYKKRPTTKQIAAAILTLSAAGFISALAYKYKFQKGYQLIVSNGTDNSIIASAHIPKNYVGFTDDGDPFIRYNYLDEQKQTFDRGGVKILVKGQKVFFVTYEQNVKSDIITALNPALSQSLSRPAKYISLVWTPQLSSNSPSKTDNDKDIELSCSEGGGSIQPV